ncbi:MAG: hypothetical protein Q4Q21_01845 [Lachnospiraceae bacterium]|nr:hypothetical protein [Lachnospiraceae bacterium]
MKHDITPGQDLVMIGEVGTYALRVLLDQRMTDIRKRFGTAYLAEEVAKLESLERTLRNAASVSWQASSTAALSAEAGPSQEGLDARACRPEGAPSGSCDPLEQLLPGYQKMYGVTKCWPVTKGGVLKALWDFCASEGIDPETGKKRGDGVGCEFRYDCIPIRQFTMEVCELFDLFPYRLWSEDCWLLAVDRGTQLVEDFLKTQNGLAKADADAIFEQGDRAGFDAAHRRTEEPVKAAVFGRFTKGKKRLRVDGVEPAYLTREDYEELERFLEGAKRK